VGRREGRGDKVGGNGGVGRDGGVVWGVLRIVFCFVLLCCVEGFDGPFGVKPGGGGGGGGSH